MDLMQLKVPPDRAALMADAVDEYIERHPDYPETAKMRDISAWLRYRISRWNANRPAPDQD